MRDGNMSEATIALIIGILIGGLIADMIVTIIFCYKIAKLEEYTGVNR